MKGNIGKSSEIYERIRSVHFEKDLFILGTMARSFWLCIA